MAELSLSLMVGCCPTPKLSCKGINQMRAKRATEAPLTAPTNVRLRSTKTYSFMKFSKDSIWYCSILMSKSSFDFTT